MFYNNNSDDIRCLDTMLSKSHCFHLLLTGDAKGKIAGATETVPIAALSFYSVSHTNNLLFIGLCAVSENTYSKHFGKGSTGKEWRQHGLLRFLLNVGKKIHRTVHLADNVELSTLVSLTERYKCTEAFHRLGFLPIAYSFKEVRFSPKSWNTKLASESLKYFPFLAEGVVHAQIGELLMLHVCICHVFILSLQILALFIWLSDNQSSPFCQYDTKTDGSLHNAECAYCGAACNEAFLMELTMAKEWLMVKELQAVYKEGDFKFTICQECQKSLSFTEGTACSANRFPSQCFKCFSAHDKLNSKQLCQFCRLPCHLSCSVVEKAVEGATGEFHLFGVPFLMTCLACSVSKKVMMSLEEVNGR